LTAGNGSNVGDCTDTACVIDGRKVLASCGYDRATVADTHNSTAVIKGVIVGANCAAVGDCSNAVTIIDCCRKTNNASCVADGADCAAIEDSRVASNDASQRIDYVGDGVDVVNANNMVRGQCYD